MRRVVSLANVRRVIGFAIVAAGVLIMFFPVSHEPDQAIPWHIDCGTSWQALFTARWNSDYECGTAAVPHLWLAGGVAAVGMCVAFWGAGRGRIVAMVGLVLLLTGLVFVASGIASTQWGGA
jgi:uncharacterized membrane protein